MIEKRWLVMLWVVAFIFCGILSLANVFLGDLNQDEGWYLYAARQVAEGEIPYKDFAYVQAPVMPYVYSLAAPLVSRWGLAAGRLFTSFLGLAAAICAAVAAARMTPREKRGAVALLVFLLVQINVFQNYYSVVVKTYSLSQLFICAGFLSLTFIDGKRKVLAAILGGVLLGAAAGTRISAVIVLPVVLLCLLTGRTGRSWIWFSVGAAVVGIVIALPFILTAPDQFWFGVVKYHAGREAGGLINWVCYKAGFISRSVQDYFLVVALIIVLVVQKLFHVDGEVAGSESEEKGAEESRLWLLPALWWSAIVVTLAHFAASFPYDDYQVMIFPVLVMAICIALVRAAKGRRTLCALLCSVFILSIAASFSSPLNQGWFVREHDRIWWRMKKQSAIRQLQNTARYLRDMSGPDGLLLTQDPYLAVESGLRLPHGLELGPFSYFPDWEREKAEKYNVLNREMFRELLSNCDAPVAALSGYALSVECPAVKELSGSEQEELWQLVRDRYTLVGPVQENFGQGNSDLRIMVRRGLDEVPVEQ